MKSLKPKTILSVLVLLSCTWQPCSGFFLDSLVNGINDTAGTFFWEIIKLIIEGPTGLVVRVLSYDFFGLREFLWGAGWWTVGAGVEKVQTVANALLWSFTTIAVGNLNKVVKWVFSTIWTGIKGAANFSKGAVGITSALDKLGEVKNKTLEKSTTVDKDNGVNITTIIGRRSADLTRKVSPTEMSAMKSSLEEAFLSASHYDQHLCLPLALCAIFADNLYLRTPQENKLVTSFR
ncbi:unnamed protein product, partial [Meganyctiphanes norvegica]